MIFWELFSTFFIIGMFTIGGGYAMLSLIQNEVVTVHGWISDGTFTDIVAISQMTPGPIGINSATYIGYSIAGFWGSVVATIAVCLPALTLMILITKFFLMLQSNRYVKAAMSGMRIIIISMIGSAALLLMFPTSSDGRSFIDHWSWIIFGVTIYASYKKVNPILLIVLSAIVGIVIYI